MAEDSRRVLEVEIPSEVVRERSQAVALQFQRHARLPGFRPGKAPLSVIRQKFQQDIRSQVLQELVPRFVEAKAKEQKWELVGSPSVTDVQFGDDTPLKFKATLEVMPEIELGDYSSVQIKVPQPTVEDEEVEKAIEHLRGQAATYVNVDPRPLQDADFASISIHGVSPGNAPGVHLEEVLCEIGGEDTVKEFTENLRGAQPGDERNFDVEYPADYRDPRLAGKTISYNVKVLGIKKKQLPELDDDFAREMGDFQTLAILREKIGEDLLKTKVEEAEEEGRRAVRKQLVEMHSFTVPETLVERQIDRRMDRLRRHLVSQGMNADNLALDWGQVRASQREESSAEVKSSLILDRIAEKEQVEVDEAELDQEIEKLAGAARQPVAAVRARLTSEGTVHRIESRLRSDKALDLIFQRAKTQGRGAD